MTTKKRRKETNGHAGNGHTNRVTQFFNLKEFKPKTKNQAEYVRAIIETDYVLCTGPPGTGKTCCAVGVACEHLAFGKIEKLVITRPIVETGTINRGIGYLPGDMYSKVHPYLRPILDELKMFLGSTMQVENLIKNDIIEIAPLEFMRGRNFHNAIMILDEAQNTTIEQVKMFVTRLGRSSTAIINGDINQTDLPHGMENGLIHYMSKLRDLDFVSTVELTDQDIVRNPVIGKIVPYL